MLGMTVVAFFNLFTMWIFRLSLVTILPKISSLIGGLPFFSFLFPEG